MRLRISSVTHDQKLEKVSKFLFFYFFNNFLEEILKEQVSNIVNIRNSLIWAPTPPFPCRINKQKGFGQTDRETDTVRTDGQTNRHRLDRQTARQKEFANLNIDIAKNRGVDSVRT